MDCLPFFPFIYTGKETNRDELLKKIRSMVPDTMEAGCTCGLAGIMLRVLGRSGEAVYGFFEELVRNFIRSN